MDTIERLKGIFYAILYAKCPHCNTDLIETATHLKCPSCKCSYGCKTSYDSCNRALSSKPFKYVVK